MAAVRGDERRASWAKAQRRGRLPYKFATVATAESAARIMSAHDEAGRPWAVRRFGKGFEVVRCERRMEGNNG